MPEKLLIVGSSDAIRAQEESYLSFFASKNLDWTCELVEELDEASVKELIEKRAYSAAVFDNPYKELAFECADIKAASAKLAFGADLLVRKDKVLLAYKTAGSSRLALAVSEGVDVKDALVLVAGHGPDALGDVFRASLYGARKVVFVSDNKQEAKRRLRAFVTEFGKLAYATIDLPPANEEQRSFREAYDDTAFSFGSFRTSTNIFNDADVIVDYREEPHPRLAQASAHSVQEVLADIFELD
ncbi:MAG: hypothetical protein ACOYD7_01725 [Raoultibacter sp.]|jgi:shikimate 5-dehydrogenase